MPGIPLPGQEGSLLGKLVGDSGVSPSGVVSLPSQEGLLGKVMEDVLVNSPASQGLASIGNYGALPQTFPLSAPLERFRPGDVPPLQPKSKLFCFEPTTMYMKTDMPY